ncbi:MAG: 50S ribosomal protein L10 [Clostridia bacterium]|nr:50S ribosomal protein L10 [Clostridia bacterium]
MPSKKVLEEKQQVVSELVERIKNSVSGVVVDYTGITVEQVTALRKELREAGVKYSVIKNKLIMKAFDQAGFSALDGYLNGMTAIVTSESDPVAPAKILCKYAEKIETFKVKGGYCDGEILDEAGLEKLAKTPSKEELLAKMLGSLQSPLYGLAIALQAVVDKANDAPAA